jgi:hypothetical protein
MRLYFSSAHSFGMSVLEDQQCAGALMCTCVMIIYLVPAASLTIGMLGVRNQRANDLVQSEHPLVAISPIDPQSEEVS